MSDITKNSSPMVNILEHISSINWIWTNNSKFDSEAVKHSYMYFLLDFGERHEPQSACCLTATKTEVCQWEGKNEFWTIE